VLVSLNLDTILHETTLDHRQQRLNCVRNGAVHPSWCRTRTDDIVSSPTVPYHPASSSAVFQYFPMFPAIPAVPPWYPAVLCKHLLSTTRRCLIWWGSSSFLMTAVLEVQVREPTAFCRPVRSFSKVVWQVGIKEEDRPRFAFPSPPGLLAVPPPGLRTHANTEAQCNCRCVGIGRCLLRNHRCDKGAGWDEVETGHGWFNVEFSRRVARTSKWIVSRPISRNRVPESEYRQCPLNCVISGQSQRPRCLRQHSIRCPVNPLCPSRTHPRWSWAFREYPQDICWNRLTLSEFRAGKGLFAKSPSWSQRYTLCQISFFILGNLGKKEPSEMLEITWLEVIWWLR